MKEWIQRVLRRSLINSKQLGFMAITTGFTGNPVTSNPSGEWGEIPYWEKRIHMDMKLGKKMLLIQASGLTSKTW